MPEKPILFSAPMVRALLAGTKTQTRRAVKPQPQDEVFQHPVSRQWLESVNGEESGLRCPYGQPGDRLWVRETWTPCGPLPTDGVLYRSDFPEGPLSIKFKPSIHMPRWASRITLDITDVRVERLQDISEADAQAEGCPIECMSPTGDDSGSAIYGPAGYRALWDTINGHGSWDANPWVWVVEFATASPTNT